ncbi:nuclear pore complex protein Nup98-Nup96-like isoform X2 [Gouania willdenowi]|uniref:nuclear pore complex protein Nup98-Nup96-like isoform X2 n=1 Tax=Gouania willdenowi TaxID=441366 RepID=UPI001054E69C|nr:nuclear pore complex protein Nup98-Nup96-like isoform X2 [Gouania willdenowi]
MFNKSFANPFGGGTGAFGASSTFRQQNAGCGTTNSFGTSEFGTTTNSGGLFGSTQNKPGGLFGSTNFSQPVTSSTSAGFGFGAASRASSLFGNTGGGAGGRLFSQLNNAFSAIKPTLFGSFGTSTSSGGGGLFGAANATSNPFGGGATSLFGGSGFTSTQQQQQQQPRKTVRFNLPSGSDRSLFGAATSSASTGLFGAATSSASTGLFGAATSSASTGLFGAATSSASTGLFGAATSSASTGLFGNKTTTGELGTGLGTSFGTVGPGHSLFGNNQKELGSTLGTMGAFVASRLNTGTSTLGFGAQQQPVAFEAHQSHSSEGSDHTHPLQADLETRLQDETQSPALLLLLLQIFSV